MSAIRSEFACVTYLVLIFTASASVTAAPLDPLDFTSLGTLNLAGGSFTIDTDALSIIDDTDPNVPLFTGIIDDQGGAADSFGAGGDVTTVGPLGVPHVAVFTFDAIDLANTASMTVTGHRALALLSQGDAQFATTIDLSGADATDGGFGTAGQRGEAGPGGFAGGGRGQAGFGPGAGGLGTGFTPLGGGAGFGSDGLNGNPSGTAGVSYGSLAALLQGGSGGGGTTSDGIYGAAGGGGGGAIEIGAAGHLAFVDASILANGGVGGFDNSFTTSHGGNGSGGGVRLHGTSIDFLGTTNIQAQGTGPGGSPPFGGGGRVLVPAEDVSVVVGDPLNVSTLLGAIDVSPSDSPLNHGVVTVLPELTIVPGGQNYRLGQATELQSATTTQPRVEALAGNLQVTGSGELRVVGSGYTNSHSIELRSSAALLTSFGPGFKTFINAGELRGTGSVLVTVVNAAGGEINLINDQLTFNIFFFAVTNNAGGQINAINSTLDFQAGLTNDGELNLINTAILGSVTGGASGAASFVGDNSVGGDLTMAPGDSLAIRLGGTAPTQFDSLAVGGDASLAGSLSVSFTGGFTLAPSQSFTIVDIAGSLSGGFNGLAEGGLVGNFGGTNLLITYSGGDGNDVTLLSALPGDFDLDGDVDGSDFLKWQRGESPRPSSAADLADWEANYGFPPLTAVSTAVPEPASCVLLLAVLVVMATGRAQNCRGLAHFCAVFGAKMCLTPFRDGSGIGSKAAAQD
jgi:hypothetical protein